MNKEDLDLSLIKENDLDKTAAFEDLMTRAERKKYLEEKRKLEDKTVEFQTEDLMEHISEEKKVEEKIEAKEETIVEENKDKNNKKNKKKKDKKNKKNNKIKENNDDIEELINEKDEEKVVIEDKKEKTGVISINAEEKKEIIEELKQLTDEEDEILIEKNPGYINNIFLSIFYIGIVTYYVYLNITNQNINAKLKDFIDYGLIAITLNYCISMITIKRAHIVFSLFTYLLYIAFISLNVLLFFKVI